MRNSGNRNLLFGLGLAAVSVAAVAAMNRRSRLAEASNELMNGAEQSDTRNITVSVDNPLTAPKIRLNPNDLSLNDLPDNVTLKWSIATNLPDWKFNHIPIAWKRPKAAKDAFDRFVMAQGDREFTILAKNPKDNKRYYYDIILVSPEGYAVVHDPSVKNRPGSGQTFMQELDVIVMRLIELAERLLRFQR